MAEREKLVPVLRSLDRAVTEVRRLVGEYLWSGVALLILAPILGAILYLALYNVYFDHAVELGASLEEAERYATTGASMVALILGSGIAIGGVVSLYYYHKYKPIVASLEEAAKTLESLVSKT